MYEQYHKIFKILTPLLLIIVVIWSYFSLAEEKGWFEAILLSFTFYYLVSIFFIAKKYRGYEKFFIDLGFYTLFILLLIHFSGSFKSPLFPFIFLPLLAAAASAQISALVGLLLIVLFYYFLMFGLSLWLKMVFSLDLAFLNLSAIAIISYLSFLLALKSKKEIDFLKDLDRQKSEFVTIASHQLRGPLVNIGWVIDELLAGQRSGSEQREYLEQIKIAQTRLMTSVNDLLAITDLDGQKTDWLKEEIELNEFIKERITKFNFLSKEKEIKIIFEEKPLPKILVNRKSLEIIFNNIFSNALNYSLPKSKVEVSAEKSDSEILVKIKDEGIGIPKERKNEVFKKFFRAPNAIRYQPEGTGLGLYISKRMIEQIGGQIWFESEENKGTTFYFTLPL